MGGPFPEEWSGASLQNKAGEIDAVSSVPFHIKICGVKSAEDIRAVANAGGEAVGLNCYAASKRYVTREVGKELSRSAHLSGVLPIALFVNEPADRIFEIIESWQLTHIQLHGDETVDLVSDLQRSGVHVVRAVRLPTGRLEIDDIEQRVSPWEQLGCSILLDADVGSAFGGAGAKLDWRSINTWRESREEAGTKVDFILAGGLDARLLSEAVCACQPAAVDVASGVEIVKGVKDAGLIEQFCMAAKEALRMND